jgi:hypothetical protein
MYVLLYCGVCIGVRLLPPGENPIAVRNNNNNNNNNNNKETQLILTWAKETKTQRQLTVMPTVAVPSPLTF